MITIETNHAGEVFAGSRNDIKEYLEDKGYILVHTVGKYSMIFSAFVIHINEFLLVIDDVFVREDLHSGKYAPDMEAWAEFDSLVGEECKMKDDQVKFENTMHNREIGDKTEL